MEAKVNDAFAAFMGEFTPIQSRLFASNPKWFGFKDSADVAVKMREHGWIGKQILFVMI